MGHLGSYADYTLGSFERENMTYVKVIFKKRKGRVLLQPVKLCFHAALGPRRTRCKGSAH